MKMWQVNIFLCFLFCLGQPFQFQGVHIFSVDGSVSWNQIAWPLQTSVWTDAKLCVLLYWSNLSGSAQDVGYWGHALSLSLIYDLLGAATVNQQNVLKVYGFQCTWCLCENACVLQKRNDFWMLLGWYHQNLWLKTVSWTSQRCQVYCYVNSTSQAWWRPLVCIKKEIVMRRIMRF